MLRQLKHTAKQSSLIRRITLAYRARSTYRLADRWKDLQPELSRIAPAPDSQRKNVLLCTSLGAYVPGTRLDSLLAAALRAHGANPSVLLCDAALAACQLCDVYSYRNVPAFLRNGPKRDICPSCYAPAEQVYAALDVRVHALSSYLSPQARQSIDATVATVSPKDIPGFVLDGVRVGEHALAGALRFFAKGNLDDEPHGAALLQAYFRSALVAACAGRAIIEQHGIDIAVFHHGIYVPQGVFGEVCRKLNVRVVNWHPAYRKGRFIFCHHDTYHRALISEPNENWEGMPWTRAHEAQVMDYLQSRWTGANDWIHFNRQPDANWKEIVTRFGLDPNKPAIGLLTNVVWDAQLHYATNAFPSMMDWLVETVEHFARRPDLQLIVRVHPAELTGGLPSRHRVVDLLTQKFPALPKNICVIPPEDPASTYVLLSKCDSAVIYATKTGIELTCMGIPVIVAGEAFIRNKGFSSDARNRTEYFSLLEKLPLRRTLSDSEVERARRYAYHFFFRRMIPLSYTKPVAAKTGGQFFFELELPSAAALQPGAEKGLDVICDGILNGREFIYDENTLASSPGEPLGCTVAPAN